MQCPSNVRGDEIPHRNGPSVSAAASRASSALISKKCGDFTSALSSLRGWFPGRRLTVSVCPPPPVLSFHRTRRSGMQ